MKGENRATEDKISKVIRFLEVKNNRAEGSDVEVLKQTIMDQGKTYCERIRERERKIQTQKKTADDQE